MYHPLHPGLLLEYRDVIREGISQGEIDVCVCVCVCDFIMILNCYENKSQ